MEWSNPTEVKSKQKMINSYKLMNQSLNSGSKGYSSGNNLYKTKIKWMVKFSNYFGKQYFPFPFHLVNRSMSIHNFFYQTNYTTNTYIYTKNCSIKQSKYV